MGASLLWAGSVQSVPEVLPVRRLRARLYGARRAGAAVSAALRRREERLRGSDEPLRLPVAAQSRLPQVPGARSLRPTEQVSHILLPVAAL